MKQQEREKSTLLMQGRLAKEEGGHDEAARLFGEAAQLEEALAVAYEAQGISEQAVRHRFSAAGCWSQAGNFHRALELCDALGREESAPVTLQEKAKEYVLVLRERRDRLWAEIMLAEHKLIAA